MDFISRAQGPSPSSLLSSAEITACTSLSLNNCHWDPVSHPRPEFHLKTPSQEDDMEQKKALASLPSR